MTLKPLAYRITAGILWLLTACFSSHAAQVIYVGKPETQLLAQRQIETAAGYYGLERKVIPLASAGDADRVIEAIRDPKTVAVVVAADALPGLTQKKVLAALHRGDGSSVPLLIAGIVEQTSSGLLSKWSAGAITSRPAIKVDKAGTYAIANVGEITRQLGGHQLPIEPGEMTYLLLAPGGKGQGIMAAKSNRGEYPVFARAWVDGQELFFATARVPIPVIVTSDPYLEPAVFSNLAPEMMFLRYAAGEKAWHSPGHYANLTIDDSWLREPYGHVKYAELLRQMEQHNFHTTIAFIPWNFDRGEAGVISLFRQNPNRFSICVHGNNHYHQEFGPYDSNTLHGQVENIKQGLARMDRFSELTNLPYDSVMVFPHSISQDATLAALKRYNFLATVNSVNVPNGSPVPATPEFALRPVTTAFSNFPSLRRYSAEVSWPPSQLAIDAFLGSPILFYVHQGFFAAGIDAFSTTADIVNRVQPDTKWESLGHITQRLFLEKLRDDGNYDIQALSGTIHLDNRHQRDATFFITKAEDFASPFTVRVDGEVYPYQRSGSELRMELPVRAGTSREIAIRYENDLNLALTDISKPSLRINATRYLSDFRDNVVSGSVLGRRFISLYAEDEARINRVLIFFAVLLVTAVVSRFAWRGRKRSMMVRDSSLGVAEVAKPGSN